LEKVPDDFTKAALLKDHWKPPHDYKFPYSETSKGVKRYLSSAHLEKHQSWLVLSPSKRGLFCKYCALFSVGNVGHNKGIKLGYLIVVRALTKFKDLTRKDGHLVSQEKRKYHKECVEAGKSFFKTYDTPQLEIVNQVSAKRLRDVISNRKRIIPIIKTMIYI